MACRSTTWPLAPPTDNPKLSIVVSLFLALVYNPSVSTYNYPYIDIRKPCVYPGTPVTGTHGTSPLAIGTTFLPGLLSLSPSPV